VIDLDPEEERIYQGLIATRGGSNALGENPVLRRMAREIVARNREAKSKTQSLRELAGQELGIKEKLALWLIWRWWKENGMEFLGKVLRLDFFAGYRMYAAGIAGCLGGLTLIAFAIAGDPRGDLKEGFAAFTAGLYAIGQAGKQDRQIEATKAVAVVTAAANPEMPQTTGDAQVAMAKITEAVETTSTPAPGAK
jgi:hypothetical protein